MRSKSRLLVLVLLAGVGAADQARAQLFPNSVSRRGTATSANRAASGTANKTGQGQTDSPDPLQGGEWMIRRARGRGAFVGANLADKIGFVGAEQATVSGAIRSAVDNARVRVNANVNQPLLPRRKNEPYRPQLSVAFDVGARPVQEVSWAVAQQLKTTPALRATSPLEVSVEGRIATLRGEVASERDRELARQMVLFEPGIDEVRNLLTVKPPQPVPATTSAPAQRPN